MANAWWSKLKKALEDVDSLGQQIYLAQTKEEAKALLNRVGNKRVLFQPYLSYRRGSDLRLYVVGDKVIGAMERENSSDFRSNIENGGRAKKAIPSEKACKIAINASKALGCDFSGVDLLYVGEDDYLVCEVNSCPHFLGLLKYVEANFADEVARFIADKMKQ